MNIRLIKLVTGEELIAELTAENGSPGSDLREPCYELANPARVVITDEGLGLMPISLFAKDIKKATIARNHVLWVAEPEDSIANAYNTQFGSGIILAKGNLV